MASEARLALEARSAGAAHGSAGVHRATASASASNSGASRSRRSATSPSSNFYSRLRRSPPSIHFAGATYRARPAVRPGLPDWHPVWAHSGRNFHAQRPPRPRGGKADPFEQTGRLYPICCVWAAKCSAGSRSVEDIPAEAPPRRPARSAARRSMPWIIGWVVERRSGVGGRIDPVIDQHVDRRKRLDMVPPQRRDGSRRRSAFGGHRGTIASAKRGNRRQIGPERDHARGVARPS